jgi:UDP-N-acetylglucosamine--N-acetylmuramyl-(pentapeptide) pyrophosphoryl-undecaprenol N-acetylglucosamine transferase
MILAGGTGGHIYPALAVAEVLRAEGVGLRWLGSAGGMESRIVPKAGIEIVEIMVSGLRGRGALGWLMAPIMLSLATCQAIFAILRFRPGVVLGMGGFVSGPGGLAAWLCRRPLVVHEQNAIPGLTNRLLSRIATKVLAAYPRSFADTVSAETSGNPVRAAIVAMAATDRPARTAPPLRLLVVGGSRGARRLNDTLPEALAALPPGAIEVWHQTGESALAATRAAYAQRGLTARVDAFIDDMPAAYHWADAAVCRAGAMTVAELAAAGLPALLVPFPHAVDDHQTANGRFMVEAGAALMLQDAALSPQSLAKVLMSWLEDRAGLLDTGHRARALARPEAAASVANHCLELLHA